MNRTCKQCRCYDECVDDAYGYGVELDPFKSAKYCTEFKPITNADVIRAMSDEELAEFLSCCGCPCPSRDCHASCKDCVLDWLKQPAEVE